MIDDLLTTRQLQEILKVDRVTIYRMLNDGRLKGIKVGTQWRFSVGEIEKTLQKGFSPAPSETSCPTLAGFPKHCVQAIQDVFAEIGQVAAITIDLYGSPLTDASQSCAFCQLMQSIPEARQACQQSWKEISSSSKSVLTKTTFTCHAGLNYTAALVQQADQPIGCLLAGQFHLHPPTADQREQRLNWLLNRYPFKFEVLATAYDRIPVVTEEQFGQLSQWPAKVAKSFQSILSERATMLERLQLISEISSDLAFSTRGNP